MTSNPTMGIAFLAGLASFLSPCVFALVPAYIGYLSGRSVAAASVEGGKKGSSSLLTLSHGLAFVVGFSVIFIAFGALAGLLGGLREGLTVILVKVGGLVVILFGLHMTKIIQIPFLNYDLRPQSQPDRNRGYLSSFLMGIFFSAGWAPCVGPILGTILTLSFSGGNVAEGATLLSAYSAGLAIPFLLAATQIGWVTTIIRRYGKVMRYAEIIMGIIMIIIGILLFFGKFATLAQFGSFSEVGEEVVAGRLLLVGVLVSLALGLAVAIIAKLFDKPFIDWWFLGTGVVLVCLFVLNYYGVLDFLQLFAFFRGGAG